MKRRLLKTAWVLLLLPALALTGCWQEVPEEDLTLPIQEEAAGDGEDLVLPAAFALPYDAAQTLDPITCADGMQQVVGALLYEGLFQLDEALEPQPKLCERYTYDAASCTYVFFLRGGVTFSDGTPLTAAHAAAALNRARSSQRYAARLYQVQSVSAGDGAVTVVLSGPNTAFPALLDIPIVKSGTEGDLVPIGTGPYAYQQDGDGPCLAVNGSWWAGGGQPTDRISLSAAKNRDLMLYQFSSHDVQLITADLTGTDPVSATGDVSFQDADTTVLQYVGFNTAREPFSSPQLRRALSLGVNRSGLTSAFLSGHGAPAQFPVSPLSPLYPAGLETAYSYNAFSSAMAAAGFNSGEARAATLLVNEENPFKVSAAEYIASALSDFDLKISVRAVPWEEYTAALAAGNFDLYYGEVKLSADWDLSRLAGTGGTLNYGGWSDAQTDQLLASYAAAEDRAAAMEALCARLQSQAPILPVCFKSTSVLSQTGVITGLTPTAADPFYGLSELEIHLNTDG